MPDIIKCIVIAYCHTFIETYNSYCTTHNTNLGILLKIFAMLYSTFIPHTIILNYNYLVPESVIVNRSKEKLGVPSDGY